MPSTLGKLKTDLTNSLGTSETRFFTNDKRTYAINKALESILKQYDIPQYTISASIAFTSGTGDLPTDCLRPTFLVGSTFSDRYTGVDLEKFLRDISQTYTLQYDTGNSKEIVKIFPADTTSLTLWYIQQHTDLSDDADTTRFNTYWDEAIIEEAKYILFMQARRYDESQIQRQVAKGKKDEAWQSERVRLTGREDNRLTSVYEDSAFVSRGGRGQSATISS